MPASRGAGAYSCASTKAENSVGSVSLEEEAAALGWTSTSAGVNTSKGLRRQEVSGCQEAAVDRRSPVRIGISREPFLLVEGCVALEAGGRYGEEGRTDVRKGVAGRIGRVRPDAQVVQDVGLVDEHLLASVAPTPPSTR